MKVCLQSGHKGITSGATGASGERDWTTQIVPMIGSRLRERGIEVYEVDAKAQDDTNVTDTDWDLFLAVHYDADIYNDTGGFTDFPEPETDSATKESQRIAQVLKDTYFPMTGIKFKSRSNANTRYYYMWQYLTEKTPCVLIECGIGNRKPEDYTTLRDYDLVADAISSGILKAFGISSFLDEDIPTSVEEAFGLKNIDRYNKYWTYNELISDWVTLNNELDEITENRNKWKTNYSDLEKIYLEQMKKSDELTKKLYEDITDKDKMIETLRKTIAEGKTPLSEYDIKELFGAWVDKLFGKKVM